MADHPLGNSVGANGWLWCSSVASRPDEHSSWVPVSTGAPPGNDSNLPLGRLRRPAALTPRLACPGEDSYLVDSASSHMLVSKIKPCMSKYKQLYGETANGSLNQLSFI